MSQGRQSPFAHSRSPCIERIYRCLVVRNDRLSCVPCHTFQIRNLGLRRRSPQVEGRQLRVMIGDICGVVRNDRLGRSCRFQIRNLGLRRRSPPVEGRQQLPHDRQYLRRCPQ